MGGPVMGRSVMGRSMMGRAMVIVIGITMFPVLLLFLVLVASDQVRGDGSAYGAEASVAELVAQSSSCHSTEHRFPEATLAL